MKPGNEEFIDLFGDDIIGIIEDELKKLGLDEEQVEETWGMVLKVIQDSPEIRQIFFEHLKEGKELVKQGHAKSYQAIFTTLLPHIWLCAITIREYPKKIEHDAKEITEFAEKVIDRISGIVEEGA